MWTSTALASEHRRYRARVWRLVEAQHRISTNRLAANLGDQAALETLAEAVKPRLPDGARHLNYLLAAPFRYGHKQASRFRKAGKKPGIFYASEAEATAITEAAYWRLRFFSRSPGFAPPSTTAEHSSFSVTIDSPSTLDLTRPPFDRDREVWIDPDDYVACQALAAEARLAASQAIRTASARDAAGINVVLLDPAAFAENKPRHGKTWHLRCEGERLTALAALPHTDRLDFSARDFGL